MSIIEVNTVLHWKGSSELSTALSMFIIYWRLLKDIYDFIWRSAAEKELECFELQIVINSLIASTGHDCLLKKNSEKYFVLGR